MVRYGRSGPFYERFFVADSIPLTVTTAFLVAIWASVAFWSLYHSASKIDLSLYRAPTHCTVLSATATAENWQVHVTYPIPGQPENFTAHLGGVEENDVYTVNQTFPCFYSQHDFHTVVQFDHGVEGVWIVSLILACFMSAAGVPGALYVLLVALSLLYMLLGLILHAGGVLVGHVQKASGSVMEHASGSRGESASPTWKGFVFDKSSHYLAILAKYYRVAVGGIRTWIQAPKPQPNDAYGMEENATLIPHGSFDYENEDERTSQHLHFTDKSDREDQRSIGSSTLFDRWQSGILEWLPLTAVRQILSKPSSFQSPITVFYSPMYMANICR